MPEDPENKIRESDFPISGDSFSSKTEQMQELANFLVSNYQEISLSLTEPGKRTVIGGRELKVYEDWLEKAHAYFQQASNKDLTLTLASEWVLDNYYIIRQALRQIGEDLPPGYYKQLPKLAGGPLKNLPRIYAMGRGVLFFQNYFLNVMDLQAVLIQVQEHVPLTMGELWALPIFLRYSLIEKLAGTLEWIIHPQPTPNLPVFPPQLIGSGNTFSGNHDAAGETLASGIVANIILSLRTISEQNWNDFFEAVSSLERTLREDPAGIYPVMDFKTRDMYRKEIESLSFASKHEENELAKITLDLARENGTDENDPTGKISATIGGESSPEYPVSHVGEYLLGKSRLLLEKKIGYKPDAKTIFKRWVLQHSSALYLGGIFFLSLLFMVLILLKSTCGRYLGQVLHGNGSPSLYWLLALLVPILTVSASLVNWLITLMIKPRILPKLSFVEGIPDPFRTLVVIPALITSHSEIDNLARQIEMTYLRNSDPGLLFALLTDFADADSETLPEDEEMIRYAAAAIEKLNAKYSQSSPDCDAPVDSIQAQLLEAANLVQEEEIPQPIADCAKLFYLLHRKRLWNQSEGRWMGWERKRGKLHELNKLLRGRTDTSFSTLAGEATDSAELQSIRFVITLDADTILPRGAARRLAGTLAHPLNQRKVQ